MNLEQFVAGTLEQIVKGVQTAQKAVDAAGAQVNPQVATAPPGRMDMNSGTLIQDIDFDVAVTVAEGEKTSAGLGIGLGLLVVGTRGASDSQNSQVSRIRFKVPLVLPKHA